MIRYPLLLLAMGGLVTGLWGGLFRAGAVLPPPSPAVVGLHGPVMVCGFLGTLISLERAVALGKLWGYLAPLLSAVGIGISIIGVGFGLGPLLVAAGSLVLCAIFVRVYRMQPAGFLVVMGLGAVAWLVGNIFWWMQISLPVVVWWWMMFLVLTIAGERLELSRMLDHDPRVMRPFKLLTAVISVGLIILQLSPDVGVRLIGAGMIGLGLWMVVYDIARYTIRTQGLTRFIAACLLAGYMWLIVGGVMAAGFGYEVAGLRYDAMLHAVFVGFVFSMIFGHAPIIFPSVLGLQVGYTPWLYLHLGILHAGLLLRCVSDILVWIPGRQIGSWMSAVAITLFLMTMVATLVSARRRFQRQAAMV